jgi:hypothetical protein
MLENSKRDGLEINTEKNKKMITSRHQYADKYHKFMTANKYVKNVEKLDIWKQQ